MRTACFENVDVSSSRGGVNDNACRIQLHLIKFALVIRRAISLATGQALHDYRTLLAFRHLCLCLNFDPEWKRKA